MIAYEIYKIIHLTSLMIFFTASAIALIGDKNIKIFKILQGLATLFILVSGMGLLARIGITHGSPWPSWAIFKVLIWLTLALSVPIINKRWPQFKTALYWPMMMLFVLAAILAVYKPQ